MSARILSIQVGQPQWYDAPAGEKLAEGRWQTAFFKEPVDGPVEFTVDGVAGDAQADRRFHGGPDKAVLAFSADHHAALLAADGIDAPPGGFGENLTVSGLVETDVCIGDRWQAGDVVWEVSQPRQPCVKLARRWNQRQLVKRVTVTGWTGWYLRVVTPGRLAAPQTLTLVERPHADWTVARAHRMMYAKPADVDSEALTELIRLPALSLAWQQELSEKLSRL